jgi:hypothetical protein
MPRLGPTYFKAWSQELPASTLQVYLLMRKVWEGRDGGKAVLNFVARVIRCIRSPPTNHPYFSDEHDRAALLKT